MSETKQYNGGCICGTNRYKVFGPPAMVAYCHCEDCRMSTGSVVAVLAELLSFTKMKISLKTYISILGVLINLRSCLPTDTPGYPTVSPGMKSRIICHSTIN